MKKSHRTESYRLIIESFSKSDCEQFKELGIQNLNLKCSILKTGFTDEANIKKIYKQLLEINDFKSTLIFSIRLKNIEEFIGMGGLILFNNKAQIFYLLLSQYFGNGYAIEFIKELLAIGFLELKLDSIEAFVPKNKEGIWKPVERSGLRYLGDLFDEELDLGFLLFKIDKKEYLNQRLY